MTEVYEESSQIKVNGRENYLVDKDKYLYKKARNSSAVKATWECTCAKMQECPCKIQVLQNKVVWRTASHNHMPDEMVVEAKVAMSRLWRLAIQTDCNISEMVVAELQNMPLDVQLHLPEPERLKANLRAARRADAKKKGPTKTATDEHTSTAEQKSKAQKRKIDENYNSEALVTQTTIDDPAEKLTGLEPTPLHLEDTPEPKSTNRKLFADIAQPNKKKTKIVFADPILGDEEY